MNSIMGFLETMSKVSVVIILWMNIKDIENIEHQIDSIVEQLSARGFDNTEKRKKK
jgi:hypothetical protein